MAVPEQSEWPFSRHRYQEVSDHRVVMLAEALRNFLESCKHTTLVGGENELSGYLKRLYY